MDKPEQLILSCENNNDNDVNGGTTSSVRDMGSPKTPIRPTLDDSFDDDDSDEMESPSFPHLIPVYNRRNSIEYDLDDVRIGWDDGCGSVCYQDYGYVTEKTTRRMKRSRNGRLFSERRHRSFFGPLKMNSSSQNSSSPSPRRINNAVIQAELNDYLGRILNCLSAKKRNRELMKSKKDTSNSTNNTVENNIVSSLLNDSADDEMMFLCSQAIEKTIAADTSCNTMNRTASLAKANSLSIVGISPLKDTNNILNNNVYHQAAKKFKSIPCKYVGDNKIDSVQTLCQSITPNLENKVQSNTSSISDINLVTHDNKDDSSSLLLNDPLASDDDLFSAIDLSAIEQQIVSSKETASVSSNQCNKVCDKQQQVKSENRPAFKNSATSNTGSVLWRRSSSTSVIVHEKPQLQHNTKTFSGADGMIVNSRTVGNTKTIVTRYCTPAEIEAKRERARNTLMLKFKLKNKSAS